MTKPMNHPFLKSVLSASLLASATALAGDPVPTTATITPAPAESKFSGTFNLDYNTHFVSYGADVWGDGNDLDAGTFNPSIELTWQLPGNFSAIIGTWWDVNGNAYSSIGGNIQEIDVWGGLSYTYGDFSITALYQGWIYGSETEEVLDIKLAYDTFLSPSLTIHNRLHPGASGGHNGTVLVFGLSHSIELGPVEISFPLNIAYFLEDDFHATSTDSGFGFGSIGVTATLPLSFISEDYGSWNIHAGLTYYITSDDVIGNPVDDNFLTANIGIGCSF